MITDFFIGVKDGFKKFGENITILVNSILLLLVYLIGVGISRISAKILKKHLLDLKKEKEKSYWTDLGLKKKKLDDYYKQF